MVEEAMRLPLLSVATRAFLMPLWLMVPLPLMLKSEVPVEDATVRRRLAPACEVVAVTKREALVLGVDVPTRSVLPVKVRLALLVMLVPLKKFTPLEVWVLALVPPFAIGRTPLR